MIQLNNLYKFMFLPIVCIEYFCPEAFYIVSFRNISQNLIAANSLFPYCNPCPFGFLNAFL